ncbi:MAG TPA: hypothetical protein VMD47_00110 [Candidatus Acidoferrales bacterium]|nr:hypothetical protein [Candidatus Acidoferrales bacterium]
MKTASSARLLFGASSVLWGVILLVWHDAGAWEQLPIPTLPMGSLIADLLALAMIAGGLGIFFAPTRAQAAMVLTIVFGAVTLAGIPAIVAAPLAFGSYIGSFEFLALVTGAAAVYADRRLTRIGLGICTISFALAQITYFKYTASLVPAWIPPGQIFWAVLTTVAFALAAIAILINVRARLAMRLMTLMLVLFGLLVWVPIVSAHPGKHFNWSEIVLNFLIAGAVWMVADA